MSKQNCKGWLYAITCSVYKMVVTASLREHPYYKLGFSTWHPCPDGASPETIDEYASKVLKRLNNRYCTSLIDPVVIAIIPVDCALDAEEELFDLLKHHRIHEKREVFCADFEETIRPAMEAVAKGHSKIGRVTPPSYKDIDDVSDTEFKALNSMPSRDMKSKIEKYIFVKCIETFRNVIQRDFDESKIFHLQHTDDLSQQVYVHLLVEFGDSQQLDIASQYRPYAKTLNPAAATLPHIKAICNLLGLAHTLDTHPIIPRGAIENNMDILEKHCNQVLSHLGLRNQRKSSDEELTFAKILPRVNKVLSNWSGMCLNDVEKHNTHSTMNLRLEPSDSKSARIFKVVFLTSV